MVAPMGWAASDGERGEVRVGAGGGGTSKLGPSLRETAAAAAVGEETSEGSARQGEVEDR